MMKSRIGFLVATAALALSVASVQAQGTVVVDDGSRVADPNAAALTGTRVVAPTPIPVVIPCEVQWRYNAQGLVSPGHASDLQGRGSEHYIPTINYVYGPGCR